MKEPDKEYESHEEDNSKMMEDTITYTNSSRTMIPQWYHVLLYNWLNIFY